MRNLIEIHKAATVAENGKDVNVRESSKLTLQIFGTSATHVVSFYGSLNGDDFAPLEGLYLGDTIVVANNSSGINQLWEFDVEILVTFRAVLTSISDGNISVLAITK